MFRFPSSDRRQPPSPAAACLSVVLPLMVLLAASARSSRGPLQESQPSRGTRPSQYAGVRCEPVAVAFCEGFVAYNETAVPNALGHQSQDEARLEVQQFWPLLVAECSRDLQFFLCAVYVPACDGDRPPAPPCRSLCASARAGCEAAINAFAFAWPQRLECSGFPENGQPCVLRAENNGTVAN